MEPEGLLISGFCLIVAGLLFLGYPEWRRRWIGFLLASAGAAQVGCYSHAWEAAMSVSWVVLLIILILIAFLEEPGEK